jgi:1,4-dihydroxy-2-naphthoyl-CoA synthase
MGTRNFRKVTNGNQNVEVCMNLTDDGMVGQQVLPVRRQIAYMTEEAKEGRNAFLEKRKPNEKKWFIKNRFLFKLFQSL